MKGVTQLYFVYPAFPRCRNVQRFPVSCWNRNLQDWQFRQRRKTWPFEKPLQPYRVRNDTTSRIQATHGFICFNNCCVIMTRKSSLKRSWLRLVALCHDKIGYWSNCSFFARWEFGLDAAFNWDISPAVLFLGSYLNPSLL